MIKLENYSPIFKPPRWFAQALHLIDPRLEARWNSLHERWEIFMRCTSSGRVHVHIMDVVDEEGKCAPLDQRVLDRLREWDTYRYGLKELIWRLEQEYARFQERAGKRLHDGIRDIVLDAANYLRCVPMVQVPGEVE